MPEPTFSSFAETRAQAATRFEGFRVNLAEIKSTVSELLSLIGRNGFFAEYSKHDISHIDEVIRLAEWLIDDETKQIMTDADWFLLTLSIYFHDMGMLLRRRNSTIAKNLVSTIFVKTCFSAVRELLNIKQE
jgi:molecular chaperone HtpG